MTDREPRRMRAPPATFARARTLRRRMTLPEVLLWQDLRGSACAELRFRRQHPIGPYVLDFYCASHRLAVEVDGTMHGEAAQRAHDAERTRWLGAEGISALRFQATEILTAERRRGVLETIAARAKAARGVSEGSWPPPPPSAVPLPREAGEDGAETSRE